MIKGKNCKRSDIGRLVVVEEGSPREQWGRLSSFNANNIWIRFTSGDTGVNVPQDMAKFVDPKPVVLIKEEDYVNAAENYEGICVKCESFISNTEPDAHWRDCENCGQCTGLGIDAALVSGFLDFN